MFYDDAYSVYHECALCCKIIRDTSFVRETIENYKPCHKTCYTLAYTKSKKSIRTEKKLDIKKNNMKNKKVSKQDKIAKGVSFKVG